MTDTANVTRGLAIIGPFGNVWSNRLYETPTEAIAHIKEFWKGHVIEWEKWKVAPATQTIEINSVVVYADQTPLNPDVY